MFGDEYKIRYEFPEYFLDYTEMLNPAIRWTDRLESSSGEWSGNLVDFFFLMEQKLLRDLKKPFMLDGITRIDETSVHKAVREALVNCITNADFNFARGIVIKKTRDSLVMENPGSIVTGKKQMLKGGVSEPRNKIIMKMFNLIKIGERAGSGVPSIFNVWEKNGWIPPVVEELYKPDRTILTLSFIPKQAEKAGDDSDLLQNETSLKQVLKQVLEKPDFEKIVPILDILEKNKKITVQEAVTLLNKSRTTTWRYLKILVNAGVVEVTGETNNTVYSLRKPD